MSDRIEKRIVLDAPVARVWRALADHREFGQWFRVTIDRPFEVGRTVSGHITYPGYEHIRWQATIVEMQPEKLLAFTWHPYAVDPEADYSQETPTRVEFRLEADGDRTVLHLTESGFDSIPSSRRAEAFRMNERGWGIQADNLREHVGG